MWGELDPKNTTVEELGLYMAGAKRQEAVKAMKEFWHKDGTRSVIASLISILIGLGAGSLLILHCGAVHALPGTQKRVEGIRLVFAGVFFHGP